MTVRFIPVRNTETGAVTQLPETALGNFPAFERLDTGESFASTDDVETPAEAPKGEAEHDDDDNKDDHPRKPARRAAAKTKE